MSFNTIPLVSSKWHCENVQQGLSLSVRSLKKQSSVGVLAAYHLIHYIQVIHYIKVSGGCLAFIAVMLEWLMQPEYFLSSH